MSDRWSQFANQIDQTFSPAAPRAGNPGSGAGNVPYAPGIISGNGGASQDAKALYANLHGQQQARDAGANVATAMGNQPPQQPSPMNPMMQAQLLDYLMNLMMRRAQSGQQQPISSSGTF